jgi:hypothetical protein
MLKQTETTLSKEACIRECEKWLAFANTDEMRTFVSSILSHLQLSDASNAKNYAAILNGQLDGKQKIIEQLEKKLSDAPKPTTYCNVCRMCFGKGETCHCSENAPPPDNADVETIRAELKVMEGLCSCGHDDECVWGAQAALDRIASRLAQPEG